MKLFICEKPSQARDLAGVLGATSKGEGLLATADKSIIVTWGFRSISLSNISRKIMMKRGNAGHLKHYPLFLLSGK